MRCEGVVLNVTDLERSIDFYCQVFGFSLLARNDQLATLSAPGSDDPQVIVLRAFGTDRLGGARHTGLRAFVLEAGSTDELEQIAGGLDSRGHLISRRDQGEWTAVVGRDPDGVTVVTASVTDGGRITVGHWTTLDDLLYGIGE
jgi:catechol 2,3-dioxygenase-like lactoylglutathione lyase family enzyme